MISSFSFLAHGGCYLSVSIQLSPGRILIFSTPALPFGYFPIVAK